jgi:hypothetical protein
MSARTKPGAITLGGEPGVDLLPPEVHERAKMARTRRMLGLLVVVAIVIVAGGYAGASFQANDAQAALAASSAQTASLLAERLKYVSASTIADQATAVQKAETEATSTEVLWGELYERVSGLLPNGAKIVSGSFKGRAPWEPELTPAGPLRQAHVAAASLVISTSTVQQVNGFMASLLALPGYADATLDSLTLKDKKFESSITLNLGDQALSGRFASTTTGADQ